MNFNKLTTTGLADYFRNPGFVIKAPRSRTSARVISKQKTLECNITLGYWDNIKGF